MDTSSGGEGSNSSEAEEETAAEESDAESGGGARRKKRRRRRGPQRGRPARGANPNQVDVWEAMRVRLAAFETEQGHCRVPYSHPADPKLGRWVCQ